MRMLDAGEGAVAWTVACHSSAIGSVLASADGIRLLCVARSALPARFHKLRCRLVACVHSNVEPCPTSRWQDVVLEQTDLNDTKGTAAGSVPTVADDCCR